MKRPTSPYEIEFIAPRDARCEECGQPQTVLTRFVSKAGEPLAVVQAALPHGGLAGRADVLISVGSWAEAPDRSDVVAFAFEATSPKAFQLAEESCWSSLWGPRLTGAEATRHDRFGLAQDVMRQICHDDRALVRGLSRFRLW